MNGLPLDIAGESIFLRPDRTLWWPNGDVLFAADLHLGKADAFRAVGVPLPGGPDEATLSRLSAALTETGAGRLVVLGDLLHHPAGVSNELLDRLHEWRRMWPALHVDLVLGNHDRHAGPLPPDLDIEAHEHLELIPFLATHHPAGDRFRLPDDAETASDNGPDLFPRTNVRMRLAGHVHPAVRLAGRGRSRLRAPCFLLQARQLILPAFGEFTGAMMVRPHEGDRVFVVGDGAVLAWPG